MRESYRRIHYGLRPAKHIERKMLAEAFRRLSPFGPPEQYRYVGLGSIYFVDFVLFHKAIGMQEMISIERDVSAQERFDFNRPYGCVKMAFGDSGEQLPLLPWERQTILWLDYDDPLEAAHLEDVSTFAASAVPGSVLVISVNVHPNRREAPNLPAELSVRVGEERTPVGLTNKDLSGTGLGIVCRQIMHGEVQTAVALRNGGLSPERRLAFRQLFYFRYQDGAMMLTYGGILIEIGQEALFEACRFGELAFVREGEEPYLIDPPKLTYRELRHLDAQLPCGDPAQLVGYGIPSDDLTRYSELYRYYPTYAEAEL